MTENSFLAIVQLLKLQGWHSTQNYITKDFSNLVSVRWEYWENVYELSIMLCTVNLYFRVRINPIRVLKHSGVN